MKIPKRVELIFVVGLACFIAFGMIYTYSTGQSQGNIFTYQLINSLVIGSSYALIAFGLSLVWGVMNLCNFAHGDFYTLAAYVSLWLFFLLGLPAAITALIAIGMCFVIGIFMEKSLLHKTAQYTTNPQYAWLITFGLSLFMENLFLNVFGPYPVKPPSLISGSINILGLGYSMERVFAGAAAIAIVVGLYAMLKFTWYGRSLRAVVQDKEAASLLGVNVSTLISLSFGLGVALAGVSGILMGPFLLVDPLAGSRPGLKAFIIVVMGGMGSLKGSVIGGILLGVIESFGAAYISPGYQDAFGFVLLILTLIFKPEGLFGKEL
jgi:branched-chain amino acid transport system permease protein